MEQNEQRLLLVVLIITFIGIIIALRDEENFKLVKKDIKNPIFIISFCIVVFISIIGLTRNDKKIRTCTEQAMIGFITAYLARFNLAFAVFFIVGVVTYYSNNN